MCGTYNTALVRSPKFCNTLSLPQPAPLAEQRLRLFLSQSNLLTIRTHVYATNGWRRVQVAPSPVKEHRPDTEALRAPGASEARRGLSPHPRTKSERENRTAAAPPAGKAAAAAARGRAAARPAGGARTQPLRRRYAAAQRPRRPGGPD